MGLGILIYVSVCCLCAVITIRWWMPIVSEGNAMEDVLLAFLFTLLAPLLVVVLLIAVVWLGIFKIATLGMKQPEPPPEPEPPF